MKCELCGCLNLIAEGKKHPSQTVWNALLLKFKRLRNREKKSIASLCEQHRLPLSLVTDMQSVAAFIEEVFAAMERFLEKSSAR